MAAHKRGLHMITFLLLVIGGLDWLIIGLFDKDVVMLLGASLARIVYILVGLSAVYEVATHAGRCKDCKGDMNQM